MHKITFFCVKQLKGSGHYLWPGGGGVVNYVEVQRVGIKKKKRIEIFFCMSITICWVNPVIWAVAYKQIIHLSEIIFEPTCANVRWAHTHCFLSVCTRNY